jgi:hypothetical protein
MSSEKKAHLLEKSQDINNSERLTVNPENKSHSPSYVIEEEKQTTPIYGKFL